MFKDIYIIMIHKPFFQREKWIVILQLLSKNNESTIVQQEDINSSSMNQGKLKVIKQEMARVNIDIVRISKLKRTGMGEFNSDDHYIYYYGQESLGRNGVAVIVNQRVWNAVLGCNLKNDRMISVRFQGKPFKITVIQAYAPTSNAEEAEVEEFYEDLQDLLELTPPKMSFSL